MTTRRQGILLGREEASPWRSPTHRWRSHCPCVHRRRLSDSPALSAGHHRSRHHPVLTVTPPASRQKRAPASSPGRVVVGRRTPYGRAATGIRYRLGHARCVAGRHAPIDTRHCADVQDADHLTLCQTKQQKYRGAGQLARRNLRHCGVVLVSRLPRVCGGPGGRWEGGAPQNPGRPCQLAWTAMRLRHCASHRC